MIEIPQDDNSVIQKLIGSSIIGEAANATLYVSQSGNDADGLTWETAFNTIQQALDAASVDGDDCTLIMISPHTTYYDIDTTGDPTWAGNYILKGSKRTWATIRNDNAGATSVLGFTGKISLENITIDCGVGNNNGLIITGANSNGATLKNVYLECENVTGPQTAIEISGNTEYAKFHDVKLHGVVAHTLGLLVDNCSLSNFERMDFHDCKTGLQITNTSPDNIFSFVFFHECALAIDIDSGDNQLFHEIAFGACTNNVDDEVDNHFWLSVHGSFPIEFTPDNFNGITVATHANPDTWGMFAQIIAAGAIDVPFRIVGVFTEANATEKFRLQFTADSGVSIYDDIQFEGSINAQKRTTSNFPSGTEFIFNAGTRIGAYSKSESGSNQTKVWLQIQEV